MDRLRNLEAEVQKLVNHSPVDELNLILRRLGIVEEDIDRCPIQFGTIQLYAEEMERNRKNFEELQVKIELVRKHIEQLISNTTDTRELKRLLKQILKRQKKLNGKLVSLNHTSENFLWLKKLKMRFKKPPTT